MVGNYSLRNFFAQYFDTDGQHREGAPVFMSHSTLFVVVNPDIYALTGLLPSESFEDVKDYQFSNLMKLTLSSGPCKHVRSITVNNTSSHAIVSLEGGDLLLITLPKCLWSIYKLEIGDWANTDESLSYMCRSIGIELPDEGCPSVVHFAWHPYICSVFAVLFTNGSLCFFDTSTGRFPIHVVTCGDGLSVDSTKNRFTAAPEEQPVSFDFGMKKLSRSGEVWPVYVLFGNGDVYLSEFAETEYRENTIAGPLRMLPLDDDNYSMTADQISCFSDMALPVLLISTREGLVYHCVVVDEEADLAAEYSLSSVHPDSLPILLVKETVELEDFGYQDNELNDQTRDRQSQTLCKVPGQPAKYVCARQGNYFFVSLDWLPNPTSAWDSGAVGSFTEVSSSVDHLLSLKTAQHTLPCPCSCSNAIIVKSFDRKSFNLIVFVIGQDPIIIELRNSTGAPEQLHGSVLDQQSFIDHITAILNKNNTQPLVKLPDTQTADEKIMLDVLCEATALLRQEYVNRLALARQECTKRVSYLKDLKTQQSALIDQFPDKCTAVSSRHAKLQQRSSDIHQKQRLLAGRLEKLLDQLRSSGGVLSADEERWQVAIQKIQSQLDKLQAQFEDMKKSVKLLNELPFSPKSAELVRPNDSVKNDSLTVSQTIRLRALLKDQHEEVESLVTTLVNASQRVGMSPRESH